MRNLFERKGHGPLAGMPFSVFLSINETLNLFKTSSLSVLIHINNGSTSRQAAAVR